MTPRFDSNSIALGALAGATAISTALHLPWDRLDAIVPAAILAASAIAVHLGLPTSRVPSPRTEAASLPPAQRPLEFLDACGATAPGIDRKKAEILIREALMEGMARQPDIHAPHVILLRHLIHMAAERADNPRDELYDSFVSNLNEKYLEDPREAFHREMERLSKSISPNPLPKAHGLVTTGILAELQEARSICGVLPTTDFLWLKSVDRPLWYALNNLGRRAFHVEGAAAIAHYQTERVVGEPLFQPNVDGAVEGLLHYWDELHQETHTPPPRPSTPPLETAPA